MVSEVVRFYGFGHLETLDMDCDRFLAYYKCIKKIRSKEMIEECRVSGYPNLGDKDRKNMIRELERQAIGSKPKKVLTMDEFMRTHG